MLCQLYCWTLGVLPNNYMDFSCCHINGPVMKFNALVSSLLCYDVGVALRWAFSNDSHIQASINHTSLYLYLYTSLNLFIPRHWYKPDQFFAAPRVDAADGEHTYSNIIGTCWDTNYRLKYCHSEGVLASLKNKSAKQFCGLVVDTMLESGISQIQMKLFEAKHQVL